MTGKSFKNDYSFFKDDQEKRVTPEGYKLNPLYVETKSKRVQLLMQPSLVVAIKEAAANEGVSMNEFVNTVLKEHLKGGEE